MKVLRGKFIEIKDHPLWGEGAHKGDLLAVWSESELQTKGRCTCPGGTHHFDHGFAAVDYIRTAFRLIEASGWTVSRVHVPPGRIRDMVTLAEAQDPSSKGPWPHPAVGALWGALIIVNADLGGETLRVRGPDEAGKPLREVEFHVPWPT